MTFQDHETIDSTISSEKHVFAAQCSGPTPNQRTRLVDIRDNLLDRIAEAEREGWFGEVDGLRVSLAGAQAKLAQIDHRPPHATPLTLGPTRTTTPQQQ
jgi:hypothetical protein